MKHSPNSIYLGNRKEDENVLMIFQFNVMVTKLAQEEKIQQLEAEVHKFQPENKICILEHGK